MRRLADPAMLIEVELVVDVQGSPQGKPLLEKYNAGDHGGDFYPEGAPDVDDIRTLNDIVMPIARALQRDLTWNSDSALTWVDIHGGTRRVFDVAGSQVRVAKNRVVAAYQTRGREGKASVH